MTETTLSKYKLIIDEWFVNGFNGSKAYRKFYPNIKKEETAAVNFSKIKAIPELKTYINEKQEEAARVIELDHKGILQELKNWLESDITQTLGLDEEQIKQLPITIRRMIQKYSTREFSVYDKKGNVCNTTKTIELTFVSKEKAVEMINKHIGFYEADNKQKNNIDLSSFTTEELIERAKLMKKITNDQR